jgi:hypothetical protein
MRVAAADKVLAINSAANNRSARERRWREIKVLALHRRAVEVLTNVSSSATEIEKYVKRNVLFEWMPSGSGEIY